MAQYKWIAAPLSPCVASGRRRERVAPVMHSRRKSIDPAFEQQHFAVSMAQRIALIHRDVRADDLPRSIEVAKWTGRLARCCHQSLLLRPCYQIVHLG